MCPQRSIQLMRARAYVFGKPALITVATGTGIIFRPNLVVLLGAQLNNKGLLLFLPEYENI